MKKMPSNVILVEPLAIPGEDQLTSPGGRQLITVVVAAAGRECATITIMGDDGRVVDAGEVTCSAEAPHDIHRDLGNALGLIAGTRFKDESAQQACWDNLVGFGVSLFEKLLPAELRSAMKAWPRNAQVVMACDFKWIPWELLHDGSEFIGSKFEFYRLPRMSVDDNAQRVRHPRGRAKARARRSRVVHVIGGGIPQSIVSDTRTFFEQTLRAEVVQGINVAQLRSLVKGADVLHLTCHGLTNPPRLQLSERDDPMLGLQLTTLYNPKFLLKPGCVVFANACKSGVAQQVLGHFVDFACEFYRKGAEVFIGTLGAVPTQGAVEFAHSFYRELAKGGNVRRAYDGARKNVAGNSLRNLYTFYGNPRVLHRVALRFRDEA